MRFETVIHVCFSLSPFPVPLRRVVHALQHQKIAPFMYGIRLDDIVVIGWGSKLWYTCAFHYPLFRSPYVAWFMHCNIKKSHHLCMASGWMIIKRYTVFLYSVGPSRIDQVTQCDLLHVTAYVTARVQILSCCCIHRHSKKGQIYIILTQCTFILRVAK